MYIYIHPRRQIPLQANSLKRNTCVYVYKDIHSYVNFLSVDYFSIYTHVQIYMCVHKCHGR